MPVPRSTPHPHVREKPRYFLRRQMNVDGEFRLPGDEVPEASTWPNLHTYLNLGWIEAVEGSDVLTEAIEIEEEPVEPLKIDEKIDKPVTKSRSKGEPH